MENPEGKFITPTLTVLQRTPIENRGDEACQHDVNLLLIMIRNHLKYNTYNIVQLLSIQLEIIQKNPYDFKANFIIDNICPLIFYPDVLKIIRTHDAAQKDETVRIMRRYIYLCCLWQLTTASTPFIVDLLQDIEKLGDEIRAVVDWIYIKTSLYFRMLDMTPTQAFVTMYTSKMPRDAAIREQWVDSITKMWDMADKSWMIALIVMYVKGHADAEQEPRYRFSTKKQLFDSKYIISCFCIHMLRTVRHVTPDKNLILYGMKCIAEDDGKPIFSSNKKFLKYTTSHIYDLDVAPREAPYVENGFLFFRENYIGMMSNPKLANECVSHIPQGIELSTDMEIREVAKKISEKKSKSWWSELQRIPSFVVRR